MKPAPIFFRSSRLITNDNRGVALITVLTVVALTTILVLSFFSLATSEHRASETYSHGIEAEQVAQQAVNMVIAQIREATSTGVRTTWASQPGAIRTWDSNGKGDAFKLYSDDEMKISGANWNEFLSDFTEIQDWFDDLDVFVDLNEPVVRGEKVYYPIVHPAAVNVPKWPGTLGGENQDDSGVEGFAYNAGNHEITNNGSYSQFAFDVGLPDGAAPDPISEGHVAMPVRWIYRLADGTLGDLKSDGSSDEPSVFIPTSGNGIPSRVNPIVARFAFWADDETSKLNLNTHAGGLAWDVPKAGGELDMNMGRYQPAQKEWQRYPGHPASTHLIPALAPGVADIVQDRDAMEMLYRVVPRVVGGGSESGTRLLNPQDPNEEDGLQPDKNPLFPSLDDMIFTPDREVNEFPDANGRPIPDEELSEYLERAKFFITVNSRAPETNAFNQPRVAIWPIYDDNTPSSPYHTPFDRLIRYCASIGQDAGGGYPRFEYIFKRKNADDSTSDYQKIARNKELYRYLLDILGRNFPGYSGNSSFSSKYNNREDQILTQIFDYIRSTNLHDDSLFAESFTDAFTSSNTANHLTFTNPRDADRTEQSHKGHGQVTPIRIGSTKGFGRFHTLANAQIHVICAGQPGGVNGGARPGARSYRSQSDIEPSGVAWTNLPPLPPNVNRQTPDRWPNWLKQLQLDQDRVDEFNAAFEEKNWNWQLAFLDDNYREEVLRDPSNRFNRNAILDFEGLRLNSNEVLLQSAILFSLYSPSVGWNALSLDMEIDITDISGEGPDSGGVERDMTFDSTDGANSVKFIGFDEDWAHAEEDGIRNGFKWASNDLYQMWHDRTYGGLRSFQYLLAGGQNRGGSGNGRYGGRSRFTPLDRKYLDDEIQQAYKYDLVTVPFKVLNPPPLPGGVVAPPSLSPEGLKFNGGRINFDFYPPRNADIGQSASIGSATQAVDASSPVQSIAIDFPEFEFTGQAVPSIGAHSPTTFPGSGAEHVIQGNRSELAGRYDDRRNLSRESYSVLEAVSITADPGNQTKLSGLGSENTSSHGRMGALNAGPPAFIHGGNGGFNDVVQSVELKHGDVRIAAARVQIPAGSVFAPHRDYGTVPMAHSVTNAVGHPASGADIDPEFLIVGGLGNNAYQNRKPLPFGGIYNSGEIQNFGDFDNGAGLMIDGPYINKPDEGNVNSLRNLFDNRSQSYWAQARNFGEFPYFAQEWRMEPGGPAYFSPNRQVSGPGMFGSLPTGVGDQDGNLDDTPWRTLLFRPDVSGERYDPHFGATDPPDHLIMDLFWMPIVEPYAISDPLSTAGKINLNYQIMPFLHIDRSTAMRGVFRSEFMVCIPNSLHRDYKTGQGRGRDYHWRDNPFGGTLQGKRLRTVILEDDTLNQFETKFGPGDDMFKSASEICEIHLVPQQVSERLGNGRRGSIDTYTPTVAQMANGSYWSKHSLVGDNSRERPYTNIYNRITTKSNTFLVHYRAQVLTQSRRDSESEYATFDPTLDTVAAEYRGSSMVERYIDPNDPNIPDFPNTLAASLDDFYRFRVVNPKRFAP